MGDIVLAKNHPFIKNFSVDVFPWQGKWSVRWRDLLTMKQDCEFNTEQEARDFAEELKNSLNDPLDEYDLYCLEEAKSFD